jgi:hypothetical protein
LPPRHFDSSIPTQIRQAQTVQNPAPIQHICVA